MTIRTDGKDELRYNMSVSEIPMVTTHSILSTSLVGENLSNVKRKAESDVQNLDACFLPSQNNPLKRTKEMIVLPCLQNISTNMFVKGAHIHMWMVTSVVPRRGEVKENHRRCLLYQPWWLTHHFQVTHSNTPSIMHQESPWQLTTSRYSKSPLSSHWMLSLHNHTDSNHISWMRGNRSDSNNGLNHNSGVGTLEKNALHFRFDVGSFICSTG